MNKMGKIGIGVVALALIGLGGSGWYHHTHFNQNVSINGVNVGGMTSQQAFDKVSKQQLSSTVKLDGRVIYHGRGGKANFTNADQSKFTKALKDQATILPSHSVKNLEVEPANADANRVHDMHTALQSYLKRQNQGRKAPVDAYAEYSKGKVKVIPAKKGNQYDLTKMSTQLRDQQYRPSINLHQQYLQPLAANSATVKNEKSKLTKLANRHVTYQVEGKKYRLATDDVISSARYDHGHYRFNTQAVNSHIKAINAKQATLDRDFDFTTHSGKKIHVQGKSYGWKISDAKAGQTLAQALADKQSQVDAKSDIYGKGYYTKGLGYGVTKNDGIGNTYAEVSLADQHAWFYRNGKLLCDFDVVTGKESSNNGTPKGLWYIMYQQSPSTLKGTGEDGKAYSSPVQYWSPFTQDGCGFHDASWRSNWSKSAYLDDGSLGCVNMHSADAGQAYKALSPHEPVVIY